MGLQATSSNDVKPVNLFVYEINPVFSLKFLIQYAAQVSKFKVQTQGPGSFVVQIQNVQPKLKSTSVRDQHVDCLASGPQ